MQVESSILGLAEIGGGRVVVYGDTNYLSSSHMVTNCYWLLKKILDFTNSNIRDPVFFSDSVNTKFPFHVDDNQLPSLHSCV
jgi:membrane-bound transcription factor site-1 protease